MKDTDVNSIRQMIAFLIRQERYRLTSHAEQRCIERDVTIEDICAVLISPAKLEYQEESRWRISGQDLDDADLTVVVQIKEYMLIITVF